MSMRAFSGVIVGVCFSVGRVMEPFRSWMERALRIVAPAELTTRVLRSLESPIARSRTR
jgi:hypothetical protein